MAELSVRKTAIPGLLVVTLPVHGDARGWFKENWQREKMTALGLPDFGPVQHSVAYNTAVGVTRGIHAEPWDKFVSIVHGKAFGAWVDLRQGPTFGAVHTEELDEATAVFVPRGVGNSYQTLSPDVVYSYLVNDHWSPHANYTHLNLNDPQANIAWPIPLDRATISEKDEAHPHLSDVTPFTPPATLILGANGQLGKALAEVFPDARGLTRAELDLSDPASIRDFDFSGVGTVINAAAYTAVDAAENDRGAAWAANATGLVELAAAAARHTFTLVHYSTDYVFDGAGGSGESGAYREDDPLAPAGVYGQSKAAGEAAVHGVARHYLIRTSWVVGEGKNFAATMASLADRGVSPTVVDDQVGRLSFTRDIAAATRHLLDAGAAHGTYHVTNSGQAMTWAEIARHVFAARGRSQDDVRGVSTEAYAQGLATAMAPRPANSVMDIGKLQEAGFTMPDHLQRLGEFLATLEPQPSSDSPSPSSSVREAGSPSWSSGSAIGSSSRIDSHSASPSAF